MRYIGKIAEKDRGKLEESPADRLDRYNRTRLANRSRWFRGGFAVVSQWFRSGLAEREKAEAVGGIRATHDQRETVPILVCPRARFVR